jgi:hypothetical protein
MHVTSFAEWQLSNGRSRSEALNAPHPAANQSTQQCRRAVGQDGADDRNVREGERQSLLLLRGRTPVRDRRMPEAPRPSIIPPMSHRQHRETRQKQSIVSKLKHYGSCQRCCPTTATHRPGGGADALGQPAVMGGRVRLGKKAGPMAWQAAGAELHVCGDGAEKRIARSQRSGGRWAYQRRRRNSVQPGHCSQCGAGCCVCASCTALFQGRCADSAQVPGWRRAW